MKYGMAPMNSLLSVNFYIEIELEVEVVCFVDGGKVKNLVKTLRASTWTKNKLNSLMALGLRKKNYVTLVGM